MGFKRRILSLVLAFSMIAGIIPLSAKTGELEVEGHLGFICGR